MESVNGDSWRRLPEFCIRQGWGIEGASDWRRSGNESSLQKPMSNVGTPLRPHRPKSCIEGSSITGLDQWLEKLERTKGSPVCFEGTTYTDRTKSLPVPPKEVSGQVHQRHSDNPGFHSSWNTTLSTSEDRQTVHLRCLPKGQPITPCALAAVQSSWLPVQSRAVLCNLPSRPNMSGEYSGQAPFNSDISSIMAENLHMKNVTKCTDRGSAEVQSQSEDSTSPGIQHFPGQVPVRLNQERGESFVSVGSCVTAGQKGQLKEWKTIMPDNHLSSGRAEVSRDSSLHRSTSTPEGPSLTVPTMGGITGLSKMRSGFSSITIASRKVPQATNNNKSDRPEHSTLTPAAPGYIAVFQPAVVYRRKATAIKVTGRRQSYTMGEALDGSHPTTFRHSYAEGDSKDNSLSPFLLQSSGSLLQDFVGTCDLSKEPVEPTCSTACLKKSEDLGGGGQKIHRSTLSLYLSRPSSGPTSGNRPRRPLSFTGGLNDTNNKTADLEQRRKSLGPSGETSNDRCHQAGPGSNTRTMQERATHGDTQHKAVDKAKDPGLLHLWNPARNPHPAFIRARVLEDTGRCTKAVENDKMVGQCPGGVMREGTADPIESGLTSGQLLDKPQKTLTLQEALVRHRPDFICRSRGRLQELKRRMQERRVDRKADPFVSPGGGHNKPLQLNENLSRPQERGVISKDTVLRSRGNYSGLADVKHRKEEDKRRVVSQANRLRVNIFKKKLLGQILQRKSDRSGP